MEIKKIKIENFKGINFLEFSPGNLNLIVGRNNVGKTTLLEAIRIFFILKNINSSFYQFPYSAHILSYGKDKGYIEINNEKIEFFKDEKILLMLLEKFRENIEESIPKYKKYVKIDEKKIKKILKLSSERWVKAINQNYVIAKINNKLVLITDKYSKIILSKIKIFREDEDTVLPLFFVFKDLEDSIEVVDKVFPLISPKFLKEELIVLKKTKKREDIKFLLQIETFIKKYNLLNEFKRFQNGFIVLKKEKIIPIDLFGDGFLQFLVLLFYLERSRKVALLDEPTAFMHPGYIKNFVRHLIEISKTKKIQLFISTHNIDFIEYFLEYPEKYLQNSLKILRLTKVEETLLYKTLNYSDALKEKEELNMDLRGV